jgi:Cu2+-exporting ATPase
MTVACGGGASGDRVDDTPTTTVFAVDGMHCTACEASITDRLGRVEGVEQVLASHADGRVVVTHQTSEVTVATIEAAIEELGYQAAASEDDSGTS